MRCCTLTWDSENNQACGWAQHCQLFEEALLIDFLASLLDSTCTTSEVKLGVAARGRAVAAEYLRSLAA